MLVNLTKLNPVDSSFIKDKIPEASNLDLFEATGEIYVPLYQVVSALRKDDDCIDDHHIN